MRSSYRGAESPNTRRDSVDSDSSRGPGKREQIAGLKYATYSNFYWPMLTFGERHIITRLEEEIRQWGSKYAMLEQENKLLESGTEQLQGVRLAYLLIDDGANRSVQAMRRLEATIDDRLESKAEGTDGERIKRIEVSPLHAVDETTY